MSKRRRQRPSQRLAVDARQVAQNGFSRRETVRFVEDQHLSRSVFGDWTRQLNVKSIQRLVSCPHPSKSIFSHWGAAMEACKRLNHSKDQARFHPYHCPCGAIHLSNSGKK